MSSIRSQSFESCFFEGGLTSEDMTKKDKVVTYVGKALTVDKSLLLQSAYK